MKYFRMLFNWIAKHKLVFGIITLAIVLAVPSSFYLWKFSDYDYSDDPGSWGVFGDYIGGTLNPIISLASFLVLSYLTYQVSKQSSTESKEQKLQERRIQAYDELLNAYRKMSRSVKKIETIYLNVNILERLPTPDVKTRAIENMMGMAKHISLLDDLSSFLQFFEVKYGKFFKFNFEGNEFKEMIANLDKHHEIWKNAFDEIIKVLPEPVHEDASMLFAFDEEKFLKQFKTFVYAIRDEIKVQQ
jgi:hypothetical protein